MRFVRSLLANLVKWGYLGVWFLEIIVWPVKQGIAWDNLSRLLLKSSNLKIFLTAIFPVSSTIQLVWVAFMVGYSSFPCPLLPNRWWLGLAGGYAWYNSHIQSWNASIFASSVDEELILLIGINLSFLSPEHFWPRSSHSEFHYECISYIDINKRMSCPVMVKKVHWITKSSYLRLSKKKKLDTCRARGWRTTANEYAWSQTARPCLSM